MSNVLPKIKQINALQLFCESASIRGISRLLNIHKRTVLRLLRRFGDAAIAFLDNHLRELTLRSLEIDEVYCWVLKKEKNLTESERLNPLIGEQWVFYGMDRTTKLVPSFFVGKRTADNTTKFMCDLAARLDCRTQISTDGLKHYPEAVEAAFGGDVDYGWIVKDTAGDGVPAVRRTLVGDFDPRRISTSLVERCNNTLRTFVRRCTRRSLCFSKKLDNFERSLALHFLYYNFVRIHGTIGMSPALKAGVVRQQWRFHDMFDALCHYLY